MEQVIVITGAGGGLGSVFARELARDGKSIAVLDYDIRAAGQVAAQIRADGGKAAAIRGNVVDKASMEQARQEVREKLGRCNVLINCAGIQDPLAKTTAESYRPGDEMDTVVAKADPDHKETVRELLGGKDDAGHERELAGNRDCQPGICSGPGRRGGQFHHQHHLHGCL